MAELQQRAKAYDLAIENIYSRTRRVLARYAGVDYNSPRRLIAERVAARSTIKAHQLEQFVVVREWGQHLVLPGATQENRLGASCPSRSHDTTL